MPLLNTASSPEDLTGLFISDLVLQILAYVAETERAFIHQRQAEGIALAKSRGTRFGRNKKAVPDDFYVYYQKWKNGEISTRKASALLDMNHVTFYRRCVEESEKRNSHNV